MNRMNGNPLRGVYAVTLAAALLFVAISISGTAQAAKPSVAKVDFDFTGTIPCTGFDIQAHLVGFLVLHTFFDGSGNPVRDITIFHATQTLTNSVTGRSLTGPTSGPNIVNYAAGTLAIIGAIWIVHGVGGVVYRDAGRIVVDLTTLTVISLSGSIEGTTAVFNDNLCSIMA